jgi:hypothetical protein
MAGFPGSHSSSQLIKRSHPSLTASAKDLRVQVRETARGRVTESQHLQGAQALRLRAEVIVERAVLVVIGDQEELSPGPGSLDIRSDKT